MTKLTNAQIAARDQIVTGLKAWRDAGGDHMAYNDDDGVWVQVIDVYLTDDLNPYEPDEDEIAR